MPFGSDAVGLLAVLSNPPTTMIRVLSYPNRSSQSLLFVGILGVLWPASASLSTKMAALNRGDGTQKRRTIFLRRSQLVIIIVGFGLALVVLFNLISCATHCRGHGDPGCGCHRVSNRT